MLESSGIARDPITHRLLAALIYALCPYLDMTLLDKGPVASKVFAALVADSKACAWLPLNSLGVVQVHCSQDSGASGVLASALSITDWVPGSYVSVLRYLNAQ